MTGGKIMRHKERTKTIVNQTPFRILHLPGWFRSVFSKLFSGFDKKIQVYE